MRRDAGEARLHLLLGVVLAEFLADSHEEAEALALVPEERMSAREQRRSLTCKAPSHNATPYKVLSYNVPIYNISSYTVP